MTPEKYKARRQKLGTQAAVAQQLGVSVLTIKRREKPGAVIPREAELALSWLARYSKPEPR